MTDQELMIYAARAIGCVYSEEFGILFEEEYGNAVETEWNPLNDDGDAFRLAAKLGIDVIWNKAPNSSYAEYLAIARRAIVKAAAKIGQNQQQTC